MFSRFTNYLCNFLLCNRFQYIQLCRYARVKRHDSVFGYATTNTHGPIICA